MASQVGQLVPSSKVQQTRGDRLMFSDNNAMMKQIQATHSPDGRSFDVKPLLHIVEDIMRRGTATLIPTLVLAANGHATTTQLEALDEKAFQNGLNDMIELLAITINRISCEISCKCTGGGDAHTTTMTLFNSLSSYDWDAKVVIALAAFAVIYGEFWLLAQLHTTNPLAKSVAHIKQLPDLLERGEALKPKFDAVTGLVKAMLDLTKCIVEFKDLPAQYISHETPEMLTATAHIPTAVYWTVRSIVACASILMNLTGMGHEYISSTSEAWELSSLAHKVSNIHIHLKKQLDLCYHHIDERRHVEVYQTLLRLIDTQHIDNMKILKALIYAKEDQLPLFESSSKRRVSIDILKKKIVLLLISDVDLSQGELSILEQMYGEAKQNPSRGESQYEVVWLPVVDSSVPWTEQKHKQFEGIQHSMPWYSVFHPSLLDRAVIEYIKEVWKFNKKALIVVLDPQGRIVNTNALHMMWIWGSLAFPFASSREEALWKEESWKIEMLADKIVPALSNWIAQEKYICLYGGEDLEWIRRFTTKIKDVAREADIPLELLYVGKSNPRDKVLKNNTTIVDEKLGHVLPDLTKIWYFWVRLESMWHSKVQHGKSVQNDPIMQEIMMVLSFDSSDIGWAVVSRGSAEMTKGKGDTILESLSRFDTWKESAKEKGFVPALDNDIRALHTPLHCSRLILPGTTSSINELVVCAECGRPMEKFIMYRCCTD